MKRRIMLLGILSIISLGIIAGYNYLNHKDDVKYNLKQSDIAIMVYNHETESYVKQSSVPKGSKYSLNEELTKCESGGKVTDYNKANGTLKYEVDVADQCYVYFDVDNTPSYAIYSETDNSLIFYKNNDTVGEVYNGRVVTAKYDDIEDSVYTYDSSTSNPNTPWYKYANDIKIVSVANEIVPINTSFWFNKLKNIENIDLTNLNTSNVTKMIRMFDQAGIVCSTFVLNLGDKFDTSKVTDMYAMFQRMGYKDDNFDLVLGNKFDTSKVTDMGYMFNQTAFYSSAAKFDLGDKFNTSNVIRMRQMFGNTACSSTSVIIDLGDKFDTSNVTDMKQMFAAFGAYDSNFTLDLGDKFDTSQVTDMTQLFASVGYSNPNFKLDLGHKFDTSKVTNMYRLFHSTGSSNPNFELDLSRFVIKSSCDLSEFIQYSASKIIFGEGWSNATLVSGMFKRDASTPLEMVNAPSNIQAYNFAGDNRVPTFTTI